MNILDKLLGKIHIRSGALLVGAFFALVGVVMIFQGIHDEGFIDLQSAIVTGKVKTGLVGVTFAFLGAVITISCVLSKPTLQKLKVQKGNASIEWEGVVNSARNMLYQMESMSKALEEKPHDSANKTNSADAKSSAAD